MKDFTRPDEGMAMAVDTAIELDASSGCVLAWQYLNMHAVPQCVGMRVLSQNGPRRTPGADDQAMLLERRSTGSTPKLGHATELDVAGCGNVLKFHVRRTNSKLASTIDHAIEMAAVHNRFYAEALLRIHAVKTSVIMRVLFDETRRRSISAQTTRLAPVRVAFDCAGVIARAEPR